MNTPAQTPQTVPKVSSYGRTDDDGGGGRGSLRGVEITAEWILVSLMSQIHGIAKLTRFAVDLLGLPGRQAQEGQADSTDTSNAPDRRYFGSGR
jgi:hypothetical protein